MLRSFRFRALVLLAGLLLAGCQARTPSSPPVPPAPSAVERLDAGRKAFAAGDCAKAGPALAEAARLAPESAEARFLSGLCAARQNEAERAEKELRLAAALDTSSPKPLEALGILQYTLGRREAARETFAEAASRGSSNAQVAYYQGNLAMFAGDCPAALLAYRRAMTLDASFGAAQTEYQAARVACARAEAAASRPAAQPDKPAAKPAPKPAKPAVKPSPAPTSKPAPATDPAPAPAPPAPVAVTP